MRSGRMFRTVLWGVEEEEVLEYMDRLLAVIEHLQAKDDSRAQGGEENREFLIRQMRKDLSGEFRLNRKRKQRRYLLAVFCPFVCIALLAALFLFRIGVAGVTGDSMSPALKPGDLVVYSREAGDYSRGDLVLCDVEGIRIIKRVAGIPGDIVNQDGNGRVRIITDINGWSAVVQDGIREIFLNQDEYFLMGDNRDMSVDSRDERIGPVQRKQMEGKALFVIRKLGSP